MDNKSKSADLEIDAHQLHSVLDSISSQLTIPFLERRSRQNMHKNNPVAELQDVI